MTTHKTNQLRQAIMGTMLIGFCLFFNQLNAANIFVDQDATGNNNGNSWVNAYTDLPNALFSASSGDLIFVAEGVYKPTSGTTRTVSFSIPSGVTIYGGFNGTETALNQRDIKNNLTVLSGNIGLLGTNADNTYRLLTFINNAETSVLDGFRLQGGNSDFPTSYDKGAVAFGINSSVELRNCEIRNCEGIKNLIHFGNGDYLLENVLMHNCTSEEALIGSGATDSEFTFRNVTLAQNSSTNSAPMFDTFMVVANFYNCIIYNTAQFASPITGSWVPNFDHCLIGGGLSSIPEGTGTNIIDAIPQFTDVNNEDFTLQETSPAIDAGLDSHVQTNIDNCGNFRFSGSSVDLGAFERSTVTYPIIYVDQDATGANDGSSWENAFVDLQDALGASSAGDYLWVADGVYKPTSGTDRSESFTLLEDRGLMGGFAGFEIDPYQRNLADNQTVLSGEIDDLNSNIDNSYHVVVCENVQSGSHYLDGLVITGGYANSIVDNANGGAILVLGTAGVTIVNCTFEDNYGIFSSCMGSDPNMDISIYNSYFHHNDQSYGIINLNTDCNLIVSNSIFFENDVENILSLNNNSTLLIEHCTMANNASSIVWNCNGDVTCNNSIIWESGNSVLTWSGSVSNVLTNIEPDGFSNCTVGILINQDPNFINPGISDYRTDSTSPAFDAGDPALTTQAKDLLGASRPYNGLPDLGCYEIESCIQLYNFCISSQHMPVYYTDYYNSTRCAAEGPYDPMSCNSDLAKNVWYRFDAPANGAVEIFVNYVYDYQTPADLRFGVYEGLCIPDPVEIACFNSFGMNESESGVMTGLISGETYWIRVEVGPGEDASFAVSLGVVELGTCPGDFDENGSVNSGDLLTFLSEFGCTSNCVADMDGNGEVNSIDLLEFLTVFGTECQQ